MLRNAGSLKVGDVVFCQGRHGLWEVVHIGPRLVRLRPQSGGLDLEVGRGFKVEDAARKSR